MKDAGVLLAVANSRYRDTIETEISRFYRNLFKTDIEAVKNPLLRESLRKVKGDDAMIEATVSCIRENGIKAGYRMGMEDGRIKGRDEGRVEGLRMYPQAESNRHPSLRRGMHYPLCYAGNYL